MTACHPSRRFLFLLTQMLLLLVFPFALQAEKVEQLKPSNYVNDFAGLMDASTQLQLNAMCKELQDKTGAQIAVVTVKSLEGVPKQDFGNRLFKAWGIGGKKDDRGVLLLLSSGDRQYWVEVGYGLEPILPDGKVGGFGREMVPLLRANNYNDALSLMTTRLAQSIAEDAHVSLTGVGQLPQQRRSQQNSRGSYFWLYVVLIFAVISLINRIRRRAGGIWLGGGGFGGGWGGGGFGGGGGSDFGGFGGGSSGGGGAGGDW